MSRRFINRSKFLALVVAFACVVVAAIGLKVSDFGLGFDDQVVSLGEPAAVGAGDVIVKKVQVGTTLMKNGEVEAETEGVFVVTTITLRAPDERFVITGSELISGSRVYSTYGIYNMSANTGFQTTNDFVYEIDPQQMDDLAIRLWQEEGVNGYRKRAVVHLGITPDNVEQWRKSAAGRAVEPTVSDTVEVIS